MAKQGTGILRRSVQHARTWFVHTQETSTTWSNATNATKCVDELSGIRQHGSTLSRRARPVSRVRVLGASVTFGSGISNRTSTKSWPAVTPPPVSRSQLSSPLSRPRSIQDHLYDAVDEIPGLGGEAVRLTHLSPVNKSRFQL